MRAKHFYMLLLVCCLGMLSSANQNSAECKKVAGTASEMKSSCCTKAMQAAKAAEISKSNIQPLNLLLFDL